MERRQILHSCCSGLRHHNFSRKDAVASIQISDPFTPVRHQQPASLRCQPCIASKPPTPFSQAPIAPLSVSLQKRDGRVCTAGFITSVSHCNTRCRWPILRPSIRILLFVCSHVPHAANALYRQHEAHGVAACSSSARHHSASILSSAFHQQQRKPWIPFPPHQLAMVKEAAVESLRWPSRSTRCGLLHNRVLKASTAPFALMELSESSQNY